MFSQKVVYYSQPVEVMEFTQEFQGGYITKPINIKRFKTENAFTVESVKLSRVNEKTVMAKLKSINPNVDLSNLTDEIRHCEMELEKHNYQNMFDSPDILSARCILPIYDEFTSDIRTLKETKCDFYQTKRSRLYAPQPQFTPRGNIIPGQTLFITVSLYYPFHWAKDQLPDEAITPHCKDSIQFYDTQTLRDIKQVFKCENIDSEISGDISGNPFKPFGN